MMKERDDAAGGCRLFSPHAHCPSCNIDSDILKNPVAPIEWAFVGQ